ncbi:hypothetical protein [Fodinibius saliphilus]|uniref:hypothetical protein n=1 Tax=Fodinibius saliphilus TaxID=1920650 RepID=UPI0014870643|nr:hypothetical protein [Fodinibius saliphilus]
MLQKSDYFILAAALLSLIFSITLWFTGSTESAIFVGLWVPSILGFANYLKIKNNN